MSILLHKVINQSGGTEIKCDLCELDKELVISNLCYECAEEVYMEEYYLENAKLAYEVELMEEAKSDPSVRIYEKYDWVHKDRGKLTR